MFNSNNGTQFTMPVVPAGGSGFGNGFGGEGGWFIWIILIIAIFGGWGYGNGNWGGFGGGQTSTSVYEGYVLNNDMSVLNKAVTDAYSMTERKLDGISNGLCDGFYTQAQLINGIDKSIANGTYSITNAITQDTIANMQNTNALATQLAQCCCDNKSAIADVKYTIGSANADTNFNVSTLANGINTAISNGFCQTNFNAQTNTRDIVDSQNANTRAILDKLCQMESNAKDDKIAELTARNADLRLAASQAAQNTYLIDQLGQKPPVGAYIVPNPYCNCNCNCNTGCGC